MVTLPRFFVSSIPRKDVQYAQYRMLAEQARLPMNLAVPCKFVDGQLPGVRLYA